jgi:hypothetical protein
MDKDYEKRIQEREAHQQQWDMTFGTFSFPKRQRKSLAARIKAWWHRISRLKSPYA